MLFLIMGVGSLVGSINWLGFRLGVAGVLFVGLAVGAMLPRLVIPDILGALGLVLFVYSMGLLSGRGLVQNLRRRGAKLFGLTALAIGCGTTTAFLVAHFLHLSGAQSAGLFTGAATNTPALAVVLELAHSTLPGETYAIAYPFGVIGVLICFHLARVAFRPRLEAGGDDVAIQAMHCMLENETYHGKSIDELHELIPEAHFRASRVSHKDGTSVAVSETILHCGDVVRFVGSKKSLEILVSHLGRPAEKGEVGENYDVVYRRVIVSDRNVARRGIQELEFPCDFTITRVRRGDAEFVPTPRTRLNYGDRIRVVARASDMEKVARFFGDSIRGMAEMDYLTVGIGLCVGVILGMIPIPIPGFGTFRLGYAGGPLIIALVLGYLERTGPLVWTMPVSANLTLRQIGLVLFLAIVGVRSGPGFVRTLHELGVPLLFGGMAITLSVSVSALVVGYQWMKIPFDELLGIVSGIHTESAAVGFASNMVQTDRPEHGYSSVYALALILKVIVAQIIFRFAG